MTELNEALKKQTLDALAASSVTVGRFAMTSEFIAKPHYGITISGHPLLLMGPPTDTQTRRQATALKDAKAFRQMIRYLGMDSQKLDAQRITSDQIQFLEGDTLSCLLCSEPGSVELGEMTDRVQDILGIITTTERTVHFPLGLILATERTLVPILNPTRGLDIDRLLVAGPDGMPTIQ